MITGYIARSVGRSAVAGQLKFGKFMWVLASACLAFAVMPIAATIFGGHHKDFLAKTLLAIGFGAAALYCFGEVVFVRGNFDEEGIFFSTPWTGPKKEKWTDLESVELNDWCSWYTLKFRDGKSIRLSRYLDGHQLALDMAALKCAL